MRKDSLSAFDASLRPTMLAITASGCPKLCFGMKKLINSILLAAGGNNTLEITYLQDNTSEYDHSVFYGISNTLFGIILL